MTHVARLTWQVPDPGAFSADLELRLGVAVAALSSPAGGLVLRLGETDLHLLPWRAEAAADVPQPGGRLVYEPLFEEPVPGVPAAGEVNVPAPPVLALFAVAWATVELDRAEQELGPWLEPGPWPEPAGPAARGGNEFVEPHLGARTRVRPASGLPGRLIVLAEPATEGRLAASLARDGEGPCALYLAPLAGLTAWRRAAMARGVTVSAIRPGPLGPSVLVAGPPAGPHLVMVEHRPLAPRSPGVAARRGS